MSDLTTKAHCVWWISISPSDLTIIIESSIADRAIHFVGFTAGRGHIRTVRVSSGQGGQVHKPHSLQVSVPDLTVL